MAGPGSRGAMRMRATLVLGLVLVGSLAASGSSLAIIATLDQLETYASTAGDAALDFGQAVQAGPASAPDAAQAFAHAELAAAQPPAQALTGFAVGSAYWATGQAYSCAHLDAGCFALQSVAHAPDAGSLAGAAVGRACASRALAPAAAQLGLSYGEAGLGAQLSAQPC